jgi:hypothetical protein
MTTSDAQHYAEALTSELAAIRQHASSGKYYNPALLRNEDAPRLLAALEAVLDMHRPGHVKLLGPVCKDHEAFPHFSITSTEADRVRACAACAATVCVTCTCGYVEFDRCPHRVAISSALAADKEETR